jgi:hypothetical protein
VDEAQELTDAEWQMLLLRCPSRSFTIVGDRAQARHEFTESWQERLERIGLDRINLASLSINYRTPEEVMAEAEPVIRDVLPDANVPTSIRSSGVPVVRGSTSDLGSILDTWLAAHTDGIACVIGDPTFRATSRVRSLTPELSKGLEFDLVVLIHPEAFGKGIRRRGRPLCRDDPSDPATRHSHELLTSAKTSSSLCLDSRHCSAGWPPSCATAARTRRRPPGPATSVVPRGLTSRTGGAAAIREGASSSRVGGRGPGVALAARPGC